MKSQKKHPRAFSFEFFPPKTAEGKEKLRATWKQLGQLKPKFFSCTFGAGGSTREGTLETVHGKRLQIFGVSNALLPQPQRAEAMRGFTKDLLPGFAEGKITPVVDKVFPFGELPAAKAYVESNAQLGKVVVRMP